MGSMLLSECKCGFQSDSLSVGGGMMDYGSKCWTPFSCSQCKSVGTINILTKEGKKGRFRCPMCRKKVEYFGEIKEDTFEIDDISYVFDWKVGEFDRSVGEWMRVRQNPKLFISTQTRVIEVVVDEKGDWIPLTPLIIVQPYEQDLWALAAALSAPVISALAARQAAGAARSVSRITLSSKQLSDLPLPSDRKAWEEAIEIAQMINASTSKDLKKSWLLFGETINQAYGTKNDDLISWWWDRHPASRKQNK